MYSAFPRSNVWPVAHEVKPEAVGDGQRLVAASYNLERKLSVLMLAPIFWGWPEYVAVIDTDAVTGVDVGVGEKRMADDPEHIVTT